MKTTIKTSDLRPVRMTNKCLMFKDVNQTPYLATRRVANDILMGTVDEVFVVDATLPTRCPNHEPHPVKMLATPSCW